MQASFVLTLKVDLIAAPNYEIYQFYQSLIKIKNEYLRFIFCLSGLLGCTSNVFQDFERNRNDIAGEFLAIWLAIKPRY